MGATPAVMASSSDCTDSSFIAAVGELCGADVVHKIAAHFGGTRFYFPEHPQPHHRICKVIGVEAAQLVAEKVGFGQVSIPLGSASAVAVRRSLIERLCLEGKSAASIARTANCAERTVFLARARLRREGKIP